MALAPYVWLIPTCIKNALSSQIRRLHTIEHFWSEFQATETPCTRAGPGEPCAAKGMHKVDLGVKMAVVAFQSKPLLGLVFHH